MVEAITNTISLHTNSVLAGTLHIHHASHWWMICNNWTACIPCIHCHNTGIYGSSHTKMSTTHLTFFYPQALKLMQEDDSAFTVYHEGFEQQVRKWPQNPVNKMIAYIKKRFVLWQMFIFWYITPFGMSEDKNDKILVHIFPNCVQSLKGQYWIWYGICPP